MRTDDFLTELQRTLTHEYLHLAMDELAREQPLPAWLTEGLARFYEYEIGLVAVRPEATTKRAFNSADQAKAATVSGALIPLASLESRTDWNSQTDEDRINLQYAESYMAVRFMIDTYGIDRLMWGSDWPVCLNAGSYKTNFEVTMGAVGDMTDSERSRFLGDNARRFYRIG